MTDSSFRFLIWSRIVNTKNTSLKPQTRLLALLALTFSFSMVALAQEEASQYDRGTPPQHAAGVSAIGSYISADLGTINLSNGSLNFRVPIASVGGRGFSQSRSTTAARSGRALPVQTS